MYRIGRRAAGILLCLCLALGAACAVTVDTSAVQELSHRIYEANKLESLLKNHRSVLLTLNGDSRENAEYCVYETADGAYAAWNGETALYARGEAVYGVEENAKLFVSPNLSEDPDPLKFCGFSLVPDTEGEWMDLTHDRFVAWTLEKGFYRYRTRYDGETSRRWIEAQGLTYNGQTVLTEALASAETAEIVKFTYYLEDDGKETPAMTWNVVYDEPEPLPAVALRAAFERAGGPTMTLTFVVDPGSEKERTRTVTVPINSVLDIYGSPAVYDDAGATVPTSFDGMEDHTFYVFTDPDRAVTGRDGE